MTPLSPLIGRRVKLVHCTDRWTILTPGELGTIDHVDSLGTVFVRWDSGSRLGLIEDAGDRYVLLDPEQPETGS